MSSMPENGEEIRMISLHTLARVANGTIYFADAPSGRTGCGSGTCGGS
jgi:hypothetical protein